MRLAVLAIIIAEGLCWNWKADWDKGTYGGGAAVKVKGVQDTNTAIEITNDVWTSDDAQSTAINGVATVMWMAWVNIHRCNSLKCFIMGDEDGFGIAYTSGSVTCYAHSKAVTTFLITGDWDYVRCTFEPHSSGGGYLSVEIDSAFTMGTRTTFDKIQGSTKKITVGDPALVATIDRAYVEYNDKLDCKHMKAICCDDNVQGCGQGFDCDAFSSCGGGGGGGGGGSNNVSKDTVAPDTLSPDTPAPETQPPDTTAPVHMTFSPLGKVTHQRQMVPVVGDTLPTPVPEVFQNTTPLVPSPDVPVDGVVVVEDGSSSGVGDVLRLVGILVVVSVCLVCIYGFAPAVGEKHDVLDEEADEVPSSPTPFKPQMVYPGD